MDGVFGVMFAGLSLGGSAVGQVLFCLWGVGGLVCIARWFGLYDCLFCYLIICGGWLLWCVCLGLLLARGC